MMHRAPLVLFRWLAAAVIPSALITLSALAQRPAPAAGNADTFDAFRVIGERNIFDPNRFPRVTRTASPEASTPSDEVVTLVGTLQYEKGTYVFFDGSRPDFRQVLPVGGKIADHTIKSIDAKGATFEGPDGSISLRVTDQLRRSPGGTWKITAAPAPLPNIVSSPSADSGRATAAVPANASDALRRLMEKRQKQLKE